jgi:two-component system OmpR family response regulator
VKVLLVEDEAHVAASLKVGLRAEGFVVVHADTGTGGLWQATENHFDVIILDIMLPGLSGYEVLRRLRERQIWTPILMLTAKDGEYDQADAFNLGADDYLVKPFSFGSAPGNPRRCAHRSQSPRVRRAGIPDAQHRRCVYQDPNPAKCLG